MYLRMLTSAQIRLDPETYEPFLTHPDLNIPLNAHDFCVQFVESVREGSGWVHPLSLFRSITPQPLPIDHVQVAALSRALNINVQVAYLDGRGTVSTLPLKFPHVSYPIHQDGHIDFVPFTNNDDHETIKELHLLYRYLILHLFLCSQVTSFLGQAIMTFWRQKSLMINFSTKDEIYSVVIILNGQPVCYLVSARSGQWKWD